MLMCERIALGKKAALVGGLADAAAIFLVLLGKDTAREFRLI